MNSKILFPILAFLMILTSCNKGSAYSGDGKLIDNGRSDPNHRYVLDLGSVNLGQDGQYTYSIKNLPKETFIIGFEVTIDPPNKYILDEKPIDCILKLRIEDEAGVAKVSEEANIRDWVWSGPVTGESVFIYRRGEPGTYFTPERGRTYKLTLQVSKSTKHTVYPIKLIGSTSGWK
jgi:hypothetical protein